jgi:hypothetical protein
MAWSVPQGSLASGASLTVAVFWPRNAYQGVQVMHAKPVPTRAGDIIITAPATFRVSNMRLSIDLNGGYTYFVDVTNEGPWDSEWVLVGGAV